MHFGKHMRDAFQDWLDEGVPDVATIEEKYEPVEVSANEMLRRFLDCTDVMPGSYCETVAAHAGIVDQNMSGMTYGNAANALLVARTSSEEAAASYLLAVFGLDEMETVQ